MTGWYPNAEQRRIPAGDNDPQITPALAILHVAVSLADTLFFFFRDRSGGVESHFYIRKDGTVEQYRSVNREADANLGANSYTVSGVLYGAVSIETAGLAGGWWNKAQKRSIEALLLWLHTEHGIHLQPVPKPFPSKFTGGVSFHSRHREWSPVVKTCPGVNRIIQYRRWLKPWMAEQDGPCLHCPRHCP